MLEIRKAQRQAKTLRRKARQAEQVRSERETKHMRYAEIMMYGLMIAMLPLSFFLFADRACGGILSAALLLTLLFQPTILCRFKTLWNKFAVLVLCTYASSALMVLWVCNLNSAVFATQHSLRWVFGLWMLLSIGWVFVLRRQGTKRLLACILLALSLWSFSFFCTERINISFDRNEPQRISAQVLDAERRRTGRGASSTRIKAAFEAEGGERVTHWFYVLRGGDYDWLSSQQEITLLHHEGALGNAWYEIDLEN